MSLEDDLLEAFELHSPEGIRKALNRGISASARLQGKTPIEHLIEMYTRSPKFAACLRVLLDAGGEISDPLLRAVLLDDAEGLRVLSMLKLDPVTRDIPVLTCTAPPDVDSDDGADADDDENEEPFFVQRPAPRMN